MVVLKHGEEEKWKSKDIGLHTVLSDDDLTVQRDYTRSSQTNFRFDCMIS